MPRALLALLTVVELAVLTACGGSGTQTGSSSAAQSPPPASTSAPSPSAPADSPASQPAVVVSPGALPTDLKSYGPASKECMAASASLLAGGGIGGFANQGKVTQALFDQFFTKAELNDYPAEAASVLADLKTQSAFLIGLNAEQVQPHLGAFSAALDNATKAAEIICK